MHVRGEILRHGEAVMVSSYVQQASCCTSRGLIYTFVKLCFFTHQHSPGRSVVDRFVYTEKVVGSNPARDRRYLIFDNVSEWLRRWIANPLLFERASSNLAVVDLFFGSIIFFALLQLWIFVAKTDETEGVTGHVMFDTDLLSQSLFGGFHNVDV